jgi:hypothetical protein
VSKPIKITAIFIPATTIRGAKPFTTMFPIARCLQNSSDDSKAFHSHFRQKIKGTKTYWGTGSDEGCFKAFRVAWVLKIRLEGRFHRKNGLSTSTSMEARPLFSDA